MDTYFLAVFEFLHESGKKINTDAIKKYKKFNKSPEMRNTLHNFDIKIKL